MIVNNTNRFVFVHIPKCAGTSIREKLEPFNEWEYQGPPWQRKHEELGYLDYGHIPLQTIWSHFKKDKERILRYWSFAVIRDPFLRFPSSFDQHLKMYKGDLIRIGRLNTLKKELSNTIEFLSNYSCKENKLPADYIHFQKQIDYIKVDGESVIDTVYRIEEIENLLYDVSEQTAHNLFCSKKSDKRYNQGMIYRNPAIGILSESLRPKLRPLTKKLQKNTKEKIKKSLFVPRDNRLSKLFESHYVRDFIKNYYYDDILIWDNRNQNL